MKPMIRCLIFATVLGMSAASAQVQVPLACGPTDETEAHALKKFGEVSVWEGNDSRVQCRLFMAESGSWTMFVVNPTNPDMLCMVGSGENGELTGNKPAQPTESPVKGGTGRLHGA